MKTKTPLVVVYDSVVVVVVVVIVAVFVVVKFCLPIESSEASKRLFIVEAAHKQKTLEINLMF